MKIGICHTIIRETLNRIVEEAEKKEHQVMLINFDTIVMKEGKVYNAQDQDIKDIDICLCREIRGKRDQANLVINYLLLNNIPIVDSRLGKGKAGTKLNTILTLQHFGINVPKTLFIQHWTQIKKELIKDMSKPYIVKPSDGQQGENVYLVNSTEEIKKTMSTNTNLTRLIQEYIENDWDMRIIVIGGKIVGAIKRIAQKGEFRNNVALWAKTEVVNIDHSLEKLAINACKELSLDIAWVDIIQCKKTKKYYVLEVNRSPEFSGFEKETTINVARKIIEYIENYKVSTYKDNS